MGILGNDPTLTTAALEELKKIPSDIACKLKLIIICMNKHDH